MVRRSGPGVERGTPEEAWPSFEECRSPRQNAGPAAVQGCPRLSMVSFPSNSCAASEAGPDRRLVGGPLTMSCGLHLRMLPYTLEDSSSSWT